MEDCALTKSAEVLVLGTAPVPCWRRGWSGGDQTSDAISTSRRPVVEPTGSKGTSVGTLNASPRQQEGPAWRREIGHPAQGASWPARILCSHNTYRMGIAPLPRPNIPNTMSIAPEKHTTSAPTVHPARGHTHAPTKPRRALRLSRSPTIVRPAKPTGTNAGAAPASHTTTALVPPWSGRHHAAQPPGRMPSHNAETSTVSVSNSRIIGTAAANRRGAPSRHPISCLPKRCRRHTDPRRTAVGSTRYSMRAARDARGGKKRLAPPALPARSHPLTYRDFHSPRSNGRAARRAPKSNDCREAAHRTFYPAALTIAPRQHSSYPHDR